ncbi:hypothetical protein ACHAXR_004372 [Thalassiosira sp. AJA248-18]
MQQSILNDGEIDTEEEKKRCERYNLGYTNESLSQRRRLFLGSLVADDSMEVLQAISTETYNIFHTVSFIESNVTQNLSPRDWKMGLQSEKLLKLQQMFGPQTKLSVDYYITALNSTDGDDLLTETLQREGNNLRWKINGMRTDDVAIVADADETFSRDYLRALQICDLPEFRPGQQTCYENKVWASTLVYEGSPNCVTHQRRWFHPDAILGECVDQIGDASSRPTTKREWRDLHGNRKAGYGIYRNYSLFVNDGIGSLTGSNYPLLSATDIRIDDAGNVRTKDALANGYHFHNFFLSPNEIRQKYSTYGHAWEGASDLPLQEVHEDLALGVDCARGTRNGKWLEFVRGSGDTLPVYYVNQEARTARHLQWQNIVHEDEKMLRNKTHPAN